MKISAYGLSDLGQVRQSNQDSILVDNNSYLYVVADGIGGTIGGDIASSLCIESMKQVIASESESRSLQTLINAFQSSQKNILDRVDREPHLAGMGTTATALMITKKQLFIAHIGDSRAYLISKNQIWQLTEDH